MCHVVRCRPKKTANEVSEKNGAPAVFQLSSKLTCLLEKSPPVGLFRSGGHRPTLFFARNPNLRPKMAQNFNFSHLFRKR